VSQKAAEAALERVGDDEITAMRDAYRERRDLAADILGGAGLLASLPAGAFYALVDLGAVDRDSMRLARRLLEEERVATAPGETFGPSGRGLVRISLASSPETVRDGCERIVRFSRDAA
jgi:aspartate/methionine/tyrosine aminotransferase